MRQSKTLLTIDERGSKSLESVSIAISQATNGNRKFCFFFWSTFVDSIIIFDCRQNDVEMEAPIISWK